MKILGILCSIIGIFLLAFKGLFKRCQGLNDQLLYKQVVIDQPDQEKIDKYKLVTRAYDKYQLIFLGLILSIIGILILAFCR